MGLSGSERSFRRAQGGQENEMRNETPVPPRPEPPDPVPDPIPEPPGPEPSPPAQSHLAPLPA
jgi:hypothetical protein